MSTNTLFLRFEGPMQSWGDQRSKFVIRRTCEAPTKSGVIGMLCAALGVPRSEAAAEWLPTLGTLLMGVRIDSPGIRWWDYHTIGAKMLMRIAEGGGRTKPGAMLTRREYLCDASFLVVLQGEPIVIDKLSKAMVDPHWTPYLGRKACLPSRPLCENDGGEFADMLSALKAVPWRPRLIGDPPPKAVRCLLDWVPTPDQPDAPEDALIWYDLPVTFDPPAHAPRFVIHRTLNVGPGADLPVAEKPSQNRTLPPLRPRANYRNTEYKNQRLQRLVHDHHLCVFCKSPATTVQHVTYRRAGGNETEDDLRSLCRLCHDAVTMIEYGFGMGMNRINPEELRWRNLIIQKRAEILKIRSLEIRRRKLAAKEVE
jgi:CRISPR system Cascade subunit CasD